MANKEFVVRNGLIVANNTTIHVTANSVGVTANSFTGNGVNITSVDALTVGGNTVPDIRTYADTKASAAYSNSVSYVNGLRLDSVVSTSTTSIAVANSVKTAYDSAIAANTRAASAQSAATAAYSNSVSYVNGLRLDSISNTSTTYIAVANSVKTAYDSAISAATAAYSNSVSYVNGLRLDSISNTSTTYIAVANSVKTAYDSAIEANTRAASAQSAATAAYSNSVSYVNGLRLDSVISTSTTSIAVANSVKTAYDSAIEANTRAASAQSAATAAYSNAVTFAANATNLTNGTVPSERLSGSYTILSSNATLSTKASYVASGGGNGTAMLFTGTFQGGQPTYVWGGNSATDNYVWNPANFSVNYATSAGNADTVDGYHASSFARYATAADFTGRVTGRGQSSGDVGVIGYSGVSTSYNGYVGYSTYSFYGTGDAYISGQIFATSNITAYYSDKRLKTNITPISKPLELLSQINGVYFTENDLAKSFGYDNDEVQIGVLAQEVQKVVPNAVTLAPFDIEMIDGKATSKSGENYLTVKYEKLVPLLIEAVKELKNEVDELRSKLENK